MPCLAAADYRPPFWLRGGHVQTWFARLARPRPRVAGRRERVGTPDDDDLWLDWHTVGERRLAILSHGLEGCSQSKYVLAMVRALAADGWDCLAWNYRGCGGTPNRQFRMYHSGATDDLATVIDHALGTGRHDALALVGFSLGGNLTLKYLAERAGHLDPRLRVAAAVSVPCDLAACAARLAAPGNRIYMHYFLRSLRRKVREKARRFPGQLDLAGLGRMRTFREFDDRVTAPVHGFASAEDYWTRCSSGPRLAAIRLPTLLINARDDPFLAGECFPSATAAASPWLHLLLPAHGGHAGFVQFGRQGLYWHEERTRAFLEEQAGPG